MNTFSKTERLCGRNNLQALYREGHKFVVWPLRVTYSKNHSDPQTAVLVWAPKSLFKRAVKRNLLKRRMREAYRLNKQAVENKGWHIAFNYMDKAVQPYTVIEKAVQKAVRKLLTQA